jgi:predicted NBD/HSP70 family sugar kinase
VSRTQNLLYIAGAVGVGAGMIVDGRIVRGSAGFAGEVGHIALGSPDRECGCGRRGEVGSRRFRTNACGEDAKCERDD